MSLAVEPLRMPSVLRCDAPGSEDLDPAATPASRRTFVLGAVVAAAVLVVGVRHRATLGAGLVVLGSAQVGWLVAAVVATLGLLVAGTVSQLGTIPVRPSVRQLFGVQVAASFANQLLPGGVGGMAVNVRFLRRLGLTRSSAMGAVGLNSLATGITHALLLVGVLVLAPGVVRSWTAVLPRSGGGGLSWHTGAVVLAFVLLTLAAILTWRSRSTSPSSRRSTRDRPSRASAVRAELGALAGVLRDPLRAVQLWGGSASAGVLHGVILLAVLRSLGDGAPALAVVAVYLAASGMSAVVPAPGAVGPLDLLLVAGLVAVGSSSPTAVAAVLGYRLVTVWLPLAPSALIFASLVRRRLL